MIGLQVGLWWPLSLCHIERGLPGVSPPLPPLLTWPPGLCSAYQSRRNRSYALWHIVFFCLYSVKQPCGIFAVVGAVAQPKRMLKSVWWTKKMHALNICVCVWIRLRIIISLLGAILQSYFCHYECEMAMKQIGRKRGGGYRGRGGGGQIDSGVTTRKWRMRGGAWHTNQPTAIQLHKSWMDCFARFRIDKPLIGAMTRKMVEHKLLE